MLCCAQERQVNWVVREYGNSQSIPTAVLLSYLRQELQVWLCHCFPTGCRTLSSSCCGLLSAAVCRAASRNLLTMFIVRCTAAPLPSPLYICKLWLTPAAFVRKSTPSQLRAPLCIACAYGCCLLRPAGH